MTYTTRTIKAAAVVLTLAATTLCISSPAFASTQDDVQSCRVAISSQSNIDMSAYRLRFESRKGIRVRTLHLKATPKKSGKSFRFSCHMKRANVIALNLRPETT